MPLQTTTLGRGEGGGGGFPWRTEAVCDRVRNVTEVQSGHANGQTVNPSNSWCQSRSSTGTGQRGGQPRHGVPPFAHL